jgi:hypothetical protein
VQNFFGPAVATGTYTGAPITLPMTGLVKANAIGNVPHNPPHTAPEFNVFVVLPTPETSGDVPAPPANLRLAPLARDQEGV